MSAGIVNRKQRCSKMLERNEIMQFPPFNTNKDFLSINKIYFIALTVIITSDNKNQISSLTYTFGGNSKGRVEVVYFRSLIKVNKRLQKILEVNGII